MLIQKILILLSTEESLRSQSFKGLIKDNLRCLFACLAHVNQSWWYPEDSPASQSLKTEGNSCWCCFHHIRGSLSFNTCCTRMQAFSSASPLTEDGSISVDVLLTPKRSSKALGCWTGPSSWFTPPWVLWCWMQTTLLHLSISYQLLLCASDLQVEFRVLVWPTSRQSRWCPQGYPTSHSFRAPHCWRVSQQSCRHSEVLPSHAGQARKLLHVLLPPHQRVCVKGHLLHSRVGI